MSTFRKRLFQERLASLPFFYKSPKFALMEITFFLISLFINPYRSCRKFLEKRNEKNVHAYGETPYTTYQRIVELCEIEEKDTWLELGSGRGKGCFWLSCFVKCRVIGIEWNPSFVRIARWMKTLFWMNRVEFIKEDFEKSSFKEASVIYVYGIWPRIDVKQGVKVISTSEPLEGFVVRKKFWVRFPWGRTSVFLQEKD